MSVKAGLVGPKLRPKGVGDGQTVNIPLPPRFRYLPAFGGWPMGGRSLISWAAVWLAV